MQRYYPFLFLLLTLASCNGVQRAINAGHYDDAVDKAVRKLRRDKSKTKNIALLETAYNKAYAHDQQRIDYLKREGDPSRQPDIYYDLVSMRQRYELLQPLLPLHLGNRDAQFQNVSDADLLAAKQNAADYLYAHAIKLLDTKNRDDARRAYNELLDAKAMYNDFRDVNAKLNDARELGTTYVLFRMLNASPILLPPDFEHQLLGIPVTDLNSDWVRYHTVPDSHVTYNYKVVSRIGSIALTPGEVEHNAYAESKQIADGWEYVLDKNGQVRKDSTGHDMKHTKYITVSCHVLETRMHKRAGIGGWVDYSTYNGELLKSVPFAAEVVYDYAYASASGDTRALSPATLAKVNAPPGVFPPDAQMLLDAAGKMKPIVKQVLVDNRGMIR